MIPQNFVEQWRLEAPWQTLAMVEQDLIISRALVELYNQPTINKELIFRGGTALNKLFINPPARYSEDIDFVQLEAKPIGETIQSIRNALDNWLGEPKRKFTERSAKLIYRYTAIDGTPAKLKIEINTTEHLQILPLEYIKYSINSEWYQGTTTIVTYQLNELMGTKLRALYQRRKGRDLFDLWLVLQNNRINCDIVIDIFTKYCQHNNQPISRATFEKCLHEKSLHKDFQSDIVPLIVNRDLWSFEEALSIVKNRIIKLLPGEQWKLESN